MKKRETKLNAWKAWCAIAGTESLASEFTLENSSHGKAFSYAWNAGVQAEREACAHLVASKPTANRETKQVLQQCAASIKERKTHERTNAPIGSDHASVELALQDARAAQEGCCLVQEARTGKEVKPTGSIGMTEISLKSKYIHDLIRVCFIISSNSRMVSAYIEDLANGSIENADVESAKMYLEDVIFDTDEAADTLLMLCMNLTAPADKPKPKKEKKLNQPEALV